ncbi:CsgE family curli-type amyloid fiber assembly protein [Maribacter dokdonensis]|uniref:CsgE family curli-type amyloid fiber assembly protein n=1 Tax=Maribacter dokdonensis TaxID=320912 RepID=UPI002AAFB40A|nr:CsgE family curli-type amyloid fiber assembly protein [Maribacter dokdonensis]
MNKKSLIFTVAFIALPFFLLAQFNREVEAQITITNENVLTNITFSAYNKTTLKKSLSYKALITKNKKLNSSITQFEDEQYFVIEPGEQKNISTASLDLSQGDRTIIFILIYEDEKVIGKDRMVINGFEGEDEMKPKVIGKEKPSEQQESQQAQDIDLLTGLVFENTKTKPGRDFYQMFYLAYNTNNIKGNKIVKVDEVLAIGGNTQIQIFAGDDLVVQFFLNPRSSYIKEMVDQSIARVNYYFQQNKAIMQNTIQY